MDRPEFIAILTPLVLAMRAEFDDPTWGAYYRVLHDVPVTVLAATVDTLMREPLEFFPKAGELRAKAERHRRMLLATKPHAACVECEDSRGWRKVLVEGALTVQRCPCVAAHQAQLEGMGLRTAIAMLPGEECAGDEHVYPTMEQLPETHRVRLQAIANQKQIRLRRKDE
jgi:hypothetical protein